jgi:hypothetical protein
VTGTGIRVDGLNEKIKALQAAGVDVKDLKKAFGDIAKDAAQRARSYAPKRSGRLAKTIKPNRSKNKAVVRTAPLAYAGPIHWGWPDRNIPASEFMLKAERSIAPTVRPRIDTELRRLMRENGL